MSYPISRYTKLNSLPDEVTFGQLAEVIKGLLSTVSPMVISRVLKLNGAVDAVTVGQLASHYKAMEGILLPVDGRPGWNDSVNKTIDLVTIDLATSSVRSYIETTSPIFNFGGDISQYEGDSGSTVFQFSVVRSNNTQGAADLQWIASPYGSNPADEADFVGGDFPLGTVSFADGESVQTIDVLVSGDAQFEFDQTFAVTLFDPSVGVIEDGEAVGTILDDDAHAQFDIQGSPVVHLEGNSGSTAYIFNVTRSNNLVGPVTVDWVVTGSSTDPADATDFVGGVLPSGTLNFADGQALATITVNVAGDLTVENDEEFTVTLSNPSEGSIGVATATGVISNEDASPDPQFDFTTSSVIHDEGNTGSTTYLFSVTRSINTTGAVQVSWAVTGSGAAPANGADFVGGVLPTGTLSFADGQSVGTIAIAVAGDTDTESDEEFTVTLSNPTAGTIGTSTATGTITNEDTSSLSDMPSLTVQGIAGGGTIAYGAYRGNLIKAWKLDGSASQDFVARSINNRWMIDSDEVLAWSGGDAVRVEIYDQYGSGQLIKNNTHTARPVLDPINIKANGTWPVAYNGYGALDQRGGGVAISNEANTSSALSPIATAWKNDDHGILYMMEPTSNVAGANVSAAHNNTLLGLRSSTQANRVEIRIGDSDFGQNLGIGVYNGASSGAAATTKIYGPAGKLLAPCRATVILESQTATTTVDGQAAPSCYISVNEQEHVASIPTRASGSDTVVYVSRSSASTSGTDTTGAQHLSYGWIVFDRSLVGSGYDDRAALRTWAMTLISARTKASRQLNVYGSSTPASYRSPARGVCNILQEALEAYDTDVYSFGMASSTNGALAAEASNLSNQKMTGYSEYWGLVYNANNTLNNASATGDGTWGHQAYLDNRTLLLALQSAGFAKRFSAVQLHTKYGAAPSQGIYDAEHAVYRSETMDAGNQAADGYTAIDTAAIPALSDWADTDKFSIDGTHMWGGPNGGMVDFIYNPTYGIGSVLKQVDVPDLPSSQVTQFTDPETGVTRYFRYKSDQQPAYVTLAYSADGEPIAKSDPLIEWSDSVPSSQVTTASFSGYRYNVGGGSTAVSGALPLWVNGLVKNPWAISTQGFSEWWSHYGQPSAQVNASANCVPYDPNLNIDPGKTGVWVPLDAGTYVKMVHNTSNTKPTDWYKGSMWANFHVVDVMPAANTTSPISFLDDKTAMVYSMDDFDTSILGAGMSPPSGGASNYEKMHDLAYCDANKYFELQATRSFLGQSPEQRRPVMTVRASYEYTSTGTIFQYTNNDDGYSAGPLGFGILWGDDQLACYFEGSGIGAAPLAKRTKAGLHFLAFRLKNSRMSDGAGQFNGHAGYMALAANGLKAVDPSLLTKFYEMRSNELNQPFNVTSGFIGCKAVNPGNSGFHYRIHVPFFLEHVDMPGWIHNTGGTGRALPSNTYNDSTSGSDYQPVSSVASVPGILFMGAMRPGSGTRDGSQFLANSDADFTPANQLTAPLRIVDAWMTYAINDNHYTPLTTTRHKAAYDALRDSMTQPRLACAPFAFDVLYHQSNYLTTPANGTMRMNMDPDLQSTETCTSGKVLISQDKIQYVDDGQRGLDLTFNWLTPEMTHWARPFRQNSHGWSPPAMNFPLTDPTPTTNTYPTEWKTDRWMFTPPGVASGSIACTHQPLIHRVTFNGWNKPGKGEYYDEMVAIQSYDDRFVAGGGYWKGAGIAATTPSWQWEINDGTGWAADTGEVSQVRLRKSTDWQKSIRYKLTRGGVTATSNQIDVPARPAQPAGTLLETTFSDYSFKYLYANTFASFQANSSAVSAVDIDLVINYAADGTTELSDGTLRGYKTTQPYPALKGNLSADFPADFAGDKNYRVIVQILIPTSYTKNLKWNLGSTKDATNYGSGSFNTTGKPKIETINVLVDAVAADIWLSASTQTGTYSTEAGNHDPRIISISVVEE